MTQEKESKGHKTEAISESVREAYNYIFYGIDQDYRHWLFAYTSKTHVLKTHPEVAQLFLEGTPTISPLMKN